MITQQQTTKAEPRFLVAKYAPDLRRMEPKNIGVILWHRGLVESRFVERQHADFVNDLETFDRWVSYWNKQLAKDTLSISREDPISREDDQYLDVFKRTQKGNYLLCEGGFLLEDVENLKDAADFLFEQLVIEVPVVEPDRATERLEASRRQVLEKVGVWNSTAFRKNTEGYPCRVHGVWKIFKFHHALVNGDPRAVFHRVLVDNDPSWQTSVFRFEGLLNYGKVKKDHCAAIVSVSPTELEDKNIRDNLQILQEVATVVNVEDHANALKVLASVSHV